MQEKIKEIRQNFSNAITTGTRSGSGKLVLENYDKLVQIWGGSPPLPCGISSDQLNNEESNSTSIGIDSELQLLDESAGENSLHSAGVNPESEENIVIIDQTALRPGKRKAGDNPVPKLIDNIRKHMEPSALSSTKG